MNPEHNFKPINLPPRSIESEILRRMISDDLDICRSLVAIDNFAMAAEVAATAIEKIHQLAAAERPRIDSQPTIEI